MALRREIMAYIGTGAIGGIVGYYAGVKELLGIQSHEESRVRNSEEPSETPSNTATETQEPDQSTGEQNSVPFEETFDDGLNGWTVDQRYRLPVQGPNPGDGGYSEKYGGSVRLHVDGGPSTIGVGQEITGLSAGTELTTTVQVENARSEPGNVSLAIFAPDGDDSHDERTSNNGSVTNGEIELTHTVEKEYAEDAEIRVWADVWPGEFTAYVTNIRARSVSE
ncbi:hypothetical protein [Haloarcula laminariae]|uniref:hypothetical protein n=1 Tax=Haloarcula laminariae TaxID=2961577 RepID=UPI0024071248|nr:hypothetical protein [Halomicroarcula sp. FL173]